MTFPLMNPFIVAHKFGYVAPLFSLNSKKSFLFFLDQGIVEESLVQCPRECWLGIIYVDIEDQP